MMIYDTPQKTIKVVFDPVKPTVRESMGFDVRALPARACGLDVKKPFTRAQVLDALAERIKKEVPGVESTKDNLVGMIIVNASAAVEQQVREFLDDLDAKTIAEAEPTR